MAYEIRFAGSTAKDLRAIRPYDRQRILDRIDSELTHTPTIVTRNRKTLPGLNPIWEHVEPIWELRVGDFRVYYDVSEDEKSVVIRAIREKPPHLTTEDANHEDDPDRE